MIEKLENLGVFGANCYIVSSETACVLVDAPCDAEYINSRLGGKKLDAILLTHGHVDHFSAVSELVKLHGCKVFVASADKPMLESNKLCLADYFHMPFYKCENAVEIKDGEVLAFGDLEFKVVATPGHTKGSVCYLLGDTLFSGDTLFYNSVGRTDFSGGSFAVLIESIKKLALLGKNYRVLCGHGQETTLYREFEHNPFLEELRK